MSEYQYYEFRTVDRPLTPEQMSQLRALSSRAVITSTSFTNTYNFGDFRGDPRKLMESTFDAHVYISNFGSDAFMLRLPRNVLPDSTLAQYAGDGLEWWTTEEHTILEWCRDEDPPDEWVEGEGWMAQLLPIREELVRGDYRSLYIGWLASIAGEATDEDDIDDEEIDDEEGDAPDEDDDDLEDEESDDLDEDDGIGDVNHLEPPLPPGLGSLTASQAALAELLGVDSDLIAAAAEASPEIPTIRASDEGVVEWVARLPEREMRTIIASVIRGEGVRMQTELQSRYHRSRSETTEGTRSSAGGRRRTAAALLARAEQTATERERKKILEREQKRHAQLAGLVPRFSELWATVRALAEEQKSSSYDKISTLLVDMRDAYVQVGRRAEFDAELARFLEQYARRTALTRRLKEVRLIS